MIPLALILSLSGLATADPCGMVPPIGVGNSVPLQRDGIQRTYVMHSRGIETMVLRPGFTGDVEHFGMLIPFPSPPAIRKIDDNTFAHIEAAIDPPKLLVNIYDPYVMYDDMDMSMSFRMASEAPEAEVEEALAYNQVKVLSEEAVGMYQVAVLAAGSPRALSAWMEDNGYRYPKGMDDVTRDYVDAKWCFVAVKAKVAGNVGATPGPGMRSAPMDRPAGSSFDGHVQGMGFRFESPDPVIPMRLSVFNGKDPHNVVYMLADQPMRIDDAPKNLVVRQLNGQEIHNNLTQPIEMVFSGGTEKDVEKSNLDALASMRDPSPFVAQAKVLFASDLLAARTGQLSLEHEDSEKELLNISEALSLRGTEIDALHQGQLTAQREQATDGALDDVKEMHLTVLDGVFPHELLAAQNLSFSSYTMPLAQNTPRTDPLRAQDLYTSVQRKERQ
jgi:hypothetical protein